MNFKSLVLIISFLLSALSLPAKAQVIIQGRCSNGSCKEYKIKDKRKIASNDNGVAYSFSLAYRTKGFQTDFTHSSELSYVFC